MNPIVRPWRQIFNFRGRATRTEYALFHVTAIGLFIAYEILIGLFAAIFLHGFGPNNSAASQPGPVGITITVILGIVTFALFVLFVVGHISIAIRRLHDHGEPWLKYLLTFIPFVGIIFWIMLVFTRGDDFENDYGPDPRQPEQVSADELGSVFS